MSIRVIAVGKKHALWTSGGVDRYEKRLKRPFNTEWVLLPHSQLERTRARDEESARIMARLTSDEFVILLDERGKEFDSPALSRMLQETLASHSKLTVVIGGAYGVNEALHTRADVVWSLSRLVFPHQLVRLILVEQLYRAQAIATNQPYHHE